MKPLAKTKVASITRVEWQQPTGILLSQKFNKITPTTTSINKSFNFANYSSTTNSLVVKKNNIQKEKQYNYSSHDDMRHYSTTTSIYSEQSITSDISLNSAKYESWTKEQVCSILCTEKKNGGAGLSIADVKPLYDITNFDGSFLASIVNHIKEKNKEYAIKKLVAKCRKADISINIVLQDTIEEIVDWIDKRNKIIDAQITPDELKNARNDPLYDYLRNLNDPLKMNKLEAMIGSNIQLPILGGIGSEYVPKEFDPTTPYLLTRQRFEILKKVITRSEEGFVFSGPHGVSKSYTMYLIACYAIVNSLPLLYVPKCGIWVRCFKRGGDNGADNYLRSLIFYYNSDILSQNQILQLYNTSKDVVSTFSTMFSKDKIIYYLFDEHNELFRPDINGKMPIQETYFRSYSRWTGVTSGSQCATMTIYCGSAHSKFEDYLPGSIEQKIIRIIPPTSLEFQKLVENFGFKLDSNRIKKIEYATGRIPRELLLFSQFVKQDNNFTDEQVKLFISNMIAVYQRRIRKLVRESNSTQIQSFLTTIHHLFNLAFIDNIARLTADPNGSFYDLGLLYMTERNYLYPINEAAKTALFEFYINNYNGIEVIDTALTSTEVGCDFERLILKHEYKLGASNHRYHLISRDPKTNSIKLSSEIISYNINSMASMDIKELNKMKELSRNNWLEGESILFIPESEQFPAIDYFIVSYISENKIQLVLKQATVSTIIKHYNNGDFKKLFTPKYLVNENTINLIDDTYTVKENGIITNDYTYSLFELIIHSIIDNYNNTTNSIQIETQTKQGLKVSNQSLRKKQFNYNDDTQTLNRKIIVNGIEISWYFVYESFVSKADQKITNIKHSNINFRNRQDLERDLNIHKNMKVI